MKVMNTMKMIPRPVYLNQLIRLRDKRLIKVITGIRRCGKSTLFDLFCEWLRNNNIVQEQIIRLNLEDPYYRDIQTDRQLYDCIHAKLLPDKMNYIFIDEVQTVRHFQKAVDGLFIQENCDVYVTGSNAYILSGELATLLSGRYIEIKMLPLSFQEYMSAMESQSDLLVKYRDYVQNGSFPYILQLESSRDRYAYL
ncbi:MAG: AAA family ATPase, partial [Caldisericia bacterium]|nr:AAA family ATPase [Caldisericia bacterium]